MTDDPAIVRRGSGQIFRHQVVQPGTVNVVANGEGSLSVGILPNPQEVGGGFLTIREAYGTTDMTRLVTGRAKLDLTEGRDGPPL